MATKTKKEQEVVAKKETPAVERVTSTRGYGKYDLKMYMLNKKYTTF